MFDTVINKHLAWHYDCDACGGYTQELDPDTIAMPWHGSAVTVTRRDKTLLKLCPDCFARALERALRLEGS